MMKFEDYLSGRRARVEVALKTVLPADGTRPPRLTSAIRYAVESGGKRIRPVVCMAAAEAVGGSAEDALMPACAIELLHSYTLVHDDLPAMDNDLLRRGKPTVHAAYGEALGILAGDSLQAYAFAVLVKTPEKKPGTLPKLFAALGRAATGVVRGQVEDTAFAANPTREIVDFVFTHKCGDLFVAAATMGALAGGASDEAAGRLAAYGAKLGVAFQIEDDLLDKDAPQDPEAPELSCLKVMSEADARVWIKSCTDEAVAALDGLPGDTAPLAALARSLVGRKR